VEFNESEYDVMTAIHLPMSERVLDKLADILFATDEIIDLLKAEETARDTRMLAAKDTVKGVYDRVNELMKTFSD